MMYSSVGLIRWEIVFVPTKPLLIPVKGINMRLYSWILEAIDKGSKLLGEQSLEVLDYVLHESHVKPFTCSLLMPVERELRGSKSRKVMLSDGLYYRFERPFKMFFASMLKEIEKAFITGLRDSSPPFEAEVHMLRPLRSEPKQIGIYNTLSPITVGELEPTEKEFRDELKEELKKRIALFRNIDPRGLKEPKFQLLTNTSKGLIPEKTVVIYDAQRGLSAKAWRFKFKMVAPEPYVSAALLGGLGKKTHLCFGYINYYRKRSP